jgi:hypothetical protein
MLSPPSLQDDVDAVQAQIARNMLDSGDWVTARLDGIKYLEKAPLHYWFIAISFRIFGVHDWAARIPSALCAVLLCWLVAAFAGWAFSPRAGLFSGLVLATSVGMWLFTRVEIPDVMLTLTITLAMWAFLRALDPEEKRPRLWAWSCAAAIGTGLLLKGLIAAVFPAAAAFLFLLFTKKLLQRETWRRLHPFSGLAIALAIAAPWHILATLRNPPYWYWSLSAGPGQYHGFFWFYFFNEHILRFLNRRYPRDYNTVPRLWFWLYHLIWLFPWSVFFPEALRSLWKGTGTDSRASRTRLLALCWAGFILVFFSFSTSQEYYSMPAYPALALLIGAALTRESAWIEWGRRALGATTGLAAVSAAAILVAVRNVPTPGDIAEALTQNPDLYTLSLGHMGDLTLRSFAYLRLPLALAAAAFLIGTFSAWFWRGIRSYIGVAVMMVVFFHAGRIALIAFDPYLASRPLAKALLASPPGELIADDQYYFWSSVFFYSNRRALLLNGRVTNLEYGSNAPDAPRDVFIDDAQFVQRWRDAASRYYLLADRSALPRFDNLVGRAALHTVAESGGKYLFTNLPAQ